MRRVPLVLPVYGPRIRMFSVPVWATSFLGSTLPLKVSKRRLQGPRIG